ncbi:hypothetical protein, partial [Stenotrophomonas acidaminiphila]|uniref:hypothetical protein n=1 Tax=Stenotrophomonas acidaminiphila TaxID=128780 RepID=UPI0028A5CEC7
VGVGVGVGAVTGAGVAAGCSGVHAASASTMQASAMPRMVGAHRTGLPAVADRIKCGVQAMRGLSAQHVTDAR